jgi:2,5-diamino-6-(ribosylamino)-4(3H)-pyrimidinone 5'-phosphate reductase
MHIRLNMATTLDGKIASFEREKVRLGSDADYRRLDLLRAWADVLVVGAGTVRAEDPPMELRGEQAKSDRLNAGRSEHPAVAVLSSSLDLPAGRTFSTPGRRLLVTTEDAGEPSMGLRNAVEIWRMGSSKVDIPALVERFESEGFDRVLLEGGGRTAAGFFKHDLVEELYLTVSRWVMGGDGAPTIADADNEFDRYNRFDLVNVEPTEEEVFLQYRRRKE